MKIIYYFTKRDNVFPETLRALSYNIVDFGLRWNQTQPTLEWEAWGRRILP